jgi:ABC-type multidrug transport system fused ATPase/permease subunit
LALLDVRQRRRYWLLTGALAVAGLLDVFGILLIGVLTTTILGEANSVATDSIPGRISFPGLTSIPSISVVTLIALVACAFVFKTIVSLFILNRNLSFLARISHRISKHLMNELFSKSLMAVQKRTSQSTYEALNNGISMATTGVLNSWSIFLAEGLLLLLISVVLFLVSPTLTVVAIVFFSVAAMLLQKFLSKTSIKAGQTLARSNVSLNILIQEGVSAFREVHVLDKRGILESRFGEIREYSVRAVALAQMVNVVPKYVMEAVLLLGSGTLMAFEYVRNDGYGSIINVAIFLIAGGRIMPSLLRMQAASNSMKGSYSQAIFTFELMDDLLSDTTPHTIVNNSVVESKKGSDFSPFLMVDSVSFVYPNREVPAIKNLTFDLKANSSLAIVGRTGSGKSTLADLILGIILPTSGMIKLSDTSPEIIPSIWPGKLGYIPQNVFLVDGTLRENIAFLVPTLEIDDSKIWEILEQVRLADHINKLPEGLETQVGANGLRFSGGQRQRIGLARALYSDPDFLLLDEATSAQDSATEESIIRALSEFKDRKTIVTIAHKMTTIREVDQVLYLENGACISYGSFEEVCSDVPEFARQLGKFNIR